MNFANLVLCGQFICVSKRRPKERILAATLSVDLHWLNMRTQVVLRVLRAEEQFSTDPRRRSAGVRVGCMLGRSFVAMQLFRSWSPITTDCSPVQGSLGPERWLSAPWSHRTSVKQQRHNFGSRIDTMGVFDGANCFYA